MTPLALLELIERIGGYAHSHALDCEYEAGLLPDSQPRRDYEANAKQARLDYEFVAAVVRMLRLLMRGELV